MQKEIKNNTHGSDAVKIRLIFIVLGVLLLFPPIVSPVSASDPPSIEKKECIGYAYSTSVNHYFLLEDNKSAFGNNITIIHNCETMNVYLNGSLVAFSNSSEIKLVIGSGFHNIELRSDNYSKNISNVHIYPDRLSWEFEFKEWESRDSIAIDEFISIVTAESRENWASILSIVMVFSLVTMVYWNLINSYVDRNYCEEVIR